MTACVRMLRPDRWLSVVFQHWDASYFATILDAVSDAGAEFKTAITQTGDVIWSMHKKKNSESVLAGEMILTFHKPGRRGNRRKPGVAPAAAAAAPEELLGEVFEACLAGHAENFTSEALFNKIVVALWRRNALARLALDQDRFAEQLRKRGWAYDEGRHEWRKSGARSAAPETELALEMVSEPPPAPCRS